MSDDSFLSRWSRRKQQAKHGEPLPAEPPPPVAPASGAPGPPVSTEPPPQHTEVAQEAPPLPTLEDVAKLSRDSDFAPFMRPGVDNGVKQAAMKKLFADPHFNIMDGLDTYIDDYNKPDPLPASMLRQMVQAKFLGLFDEEENAPERASLPAATPDGAAAPAAPSSQPPLAHEDPDLQLQPDDAAGREGAGGGADGDPRRVG